MSSPFIAGHRGFKGSYPENTMLGFAKCYEAGATIIETDLYLTADNIIVVSHDNNTKRIFCHPDGSDADLDITKSTWDDLKDLRNKKTGDPLIRFASLARWLTQQPLGCKIQLDIKRFNRLAIMKYLLEELLEVNSDLDYWTSRLQVGIWELDFIKYVNQDEYFQKLSLSKKFDIFHISTSWNSSIQYIGYNHYLLQFSKERHIYPLTGVSILYLATWSRGFLEKFLPLCRVEGLKVYSWTINNSAQYTYFVKACKIEGIGEYGLVSDHPDKMVELKGEDDGAAPVSSARSLLSYTQRISGFMFGLFVRFGVTPPPVNYGSQVWANDVSRVRFRPIFARLFQVCQKFGIF